jgi:hypothetical protein
MDARYAGLVEQRTALIGECPLWKTPTSPRCKGPCQHRVQAKGMMIVCFKTCRPPVVLCNEAKEVKIC